MLYDGVDQTFVDETTQFGELAQTMSNDINPRPLFGPDKRTKSRRPTSSTCAVKPYKRKIVNNASPPKTIVMRRDKTLRELSKRATSRPRSRSRSRSMSKSRSRSQTRSKSRSRSRSRSKTRSRTVTSPIRKGKLKNGKSKDCVRFKTWIWSIRL